VYWEYHLVDGKMVEHQALFDRASLFRQIGAQLTSENACKIK
jgi:predicted ester cyclase